MQVIIFTHEPLAETKKLLNYFDQQKLWGLDGLLPKSNCVAFCYYIAS